MNLLSAPWCLCSAAESRVHSPWTSRTESWSTTTPQIAVEWYRRQCRRSGTKFRPISSAVASTRTKIGTTSMTGKTRSGFRSRAAAPDTRCRLNLMKDRATIRLTSIAESKIAPFHEILYLWGVSLRKQRPDLWWNQGCLSALQQLMIRKLHVVGIVAIVVAFFQVNSKFHSYRVLVKTSTFLCSSCSDWSSACFCSAQSEGKLSLQFRRAFKFDRDSHLGGKPWMFDSMWFWSC